MVVHEKVLTAAHRLAVRLVQIVIIVVVVKLTRKIATRPPGLIVGSGLAMFQHFRKTLQQ